MLKEQKGITLVALIITIIVMLILAGVSISLVVGENGVMTQAQNAGDANVKGAVRDAITMANAEMVSAFYSNSANYGGTSGKIEDADDILAAINNNYKGYTSNTLSIKSGTISAITDEATSDIVIEIAGLKNTNENTITVECKTEVVGASHYFVISAK